MKSLFPFPWWWDLCCAWKKNKENILNMDFLFRICTDLGCSSVIIKVNTCTNTSNKTPKGALVYNWPSARTEPQKALKPKGKCHLLLHYSIKRQWWFCLFFFFYFQSPAGKASRARILVMNLCVPWDGRSGSYRIIDSRGSWCQEKSTRLWR